MSQFYNKSRLMSSVHFFNDRYNYIVCNHTLSLAHMLNYLLDCRFHTGFDDG
jgi:hypothetical protein